MRKNTFIIIIIILIVLGAGAYLFIKNMNAPTSTEMTTDTAANTTPTDKYAVVDPNDPANKPPVDVAVTSDVKLGTKYISSATWPPKVQASQKPFACIEGGKETDAKGKTEEKTINNQIYCVNTKAEGAAGSTYRTYTYTTAEDEHSVMTSFTLQFVNCGNYDATEMAACKSEQSSFDLDNIIDEIVNSVNLQ